MILLLIGKTKIRKETAFGLVLQTQCLDMFVSSHMQRNATQRKKKKNLNPVNQNHNKYIVQLRVAR